MDRGDESQHAQRACEGLAALSAAFHAGLRKPQDFGGATPKSWGGQRFIQVDISPQEADSNVRIEAPVVGDIASCVKALLANMDTS